MAVTRVHTIEVKDFEDLRTTMIAYHKEQQERWLAIDGRTQRDKREYSTRGEVHEEMVEFWENVVFKTPTKRRRKYTGIS